MKTIRLCFDHDSSVGAIVSTLRGEGIDVQTAREAGLSAADDSAQAAHAISENRVLITGDHGLRALMEERTRIGDHHPGVLFLPASQRYSIGPILDSIRIVNSCVSPDEMMDTVLYIPI